MDGGGAPGEAIGTVHVIMIADGVTIGGAFQVFTAMCIQGGEDITEVIIGMVARGTTDRFLINDLYVGITGITGVN
jgi:hypothetical protein